MNNTWNVPTAAGVEGQDAETLIRRVLLCQGVRVAVYRIFEDALATYLEDGDASLFQAVTAAVTTEFTAVSETIKACAAALGPPLAASIKELQVIEREKLHLTALLHDARSAYALRRREAQSRRREPRGGAGVEAPATAGEVPVGVAHGGAVAPAEPSGAAGCATITESDATQEAGGPGEGCRADAGAEWREMVASAVDALCSADPRAGYSGTLLNLGQQRPAPRVPEQSSCLWGINDDAAVTRAAAAVTDVEGRAREATDELRAELATIVAAGV